MKTAFKTVATLLFLYLLLPIFSNVYAGTRSTPLIVDHRAVLEFNQIPDYWLEQAKQFNFHYAHTSHGSQIISGLRALETENAKYNISVMNAGSLPPTSLTCDANSLCIYSGNPPETYITPEDYWSTQSGIDRTRAVANTGFFDFSMWSWCSQQETNTTSTVQTYLNTMNSFDQDYPNMHFLYMTGHTVFDQNDPNSTLRQNNQMVKEYVIANNKVLFDYDDIERFNPDGVEYTNANDNCVWCIDWCNAHPNDCNVLPESCAHSASSAGDTRVSYLCKAKAQAFWWMMAKLAGWDSQEPSSSPAVLTSPSPSPSPSPALSPSPSPDTPTSPSPSPAVSPAPVDLKGDVNHDSEVNKQDILLTLRNYGKDPSQITNYDDPYPDNIINGFDFVWILIDWLKT
ncbi:hypothetical protein ACFLZ1_04600 [Patescibacteria group bacterium]